VWWARRDLNPRPRDYEYLANEESTVYRDLYGVRFASICALLSFQRYKGNKLVQAGTGHKIGHSGLGCHRSELNGHSNLCPMANEY
jgi:hypothetical protein